jgi:hypothetical protein
VLSAEVRIRMKQGRWQRAAFRDVGGCPSAAWVIDMLISASLRHDRQKEGQASRPTWTAVTTSPAACVSFQSRALVTIASTHTIHRVTTPARTQAAVTRPHPVAPAATPELDRCAHPTI